MFAVSLFTGAGGGALGLQRAGYDVLGFDADERACSTARANDIHSWHADVRTIDFRAINGIDLLLGGPPCQPFSGAGDHGGEFDPRDMIPEFVRAVEESRPRVFVMENVRGLTYPIHRAYFEKVLGAFPPEYRVAWRLENAADFGVPQRRQRLVVVGRRDGLDPIFPVPTHGPVATASLRPWATADTVLDGELLETNRGQTASGERQTSSLIVPAPTFTTKAIGQWKVDGRHLTIEEAARLQGFPPGWRFVGGRTAAGKQIGNAAPPALVQAVATANAEFVEVPVADFLEHVPWTAVRGGVTVAEMLDADPETYTGRRCFTTRDRLTGFTLTGDELGGVFNVGPHGRGAAAVGTAVQLGARRLDCFEPFLPEWYRAQGWVVERWEDNWTPGGPRVAYMSHPGPALELADAA